MNTKSLSNPEVGQIDKMIFLIRDQKVMLDSDLARIYGTTTKRLNEQVSRNASRFPEDFMFRLSFQEVNHLRSHFATSSFHGGRRYRPWVFTEHGAVMLAGVLNTPVAVNASVQIVRSFIQMREMLLTQKDLASKLDKLEKRYDAQFKVVFNSIKELINAQPKAETRQLNKRKLGFRRD